MSRYSKKHYEDTAKIINGAMKDWRDGYSSGDDAIINIAYSLADLFEKDNPNFDRERFLEATR